MQALIGKTGKEGLKRRVMECDPNKLPITPAERTMALLSKYDLEQVRDVSAGAAVFFAWVSITYIGVILICTFRVPSFMFSKLPNPCSSVF